MQGAASKDISSLQTTKVKFKRSEFADVIIKSLDREVNRLSCTLEQNERARRVVQRDMAREERQTVKMSQRIRPSELITMLSLHSEEEGNAPASKIEPATARNSPRRTTPCSPRIRANTAKASTRCYRDRAARPSSSNFDRIEDIDPQTEDKDSANRQEERSQAKAACRKKLFDTLSKPKHRSDVLSVRERLRQEFGKQRPRTSHGQPSVPSGQGHCSAKVVISGSGKNAEAILTPRNRSKVPAYSAKLRNHGRDTLDSCGLSPGDLQTLLATPVPMVVKRNLDST